MNFLFLGLALTLSFVATISSAQELAPQQPSSRLVPRRGRPQGTDWLNDAATFGRWAFTRDTHIDLGLSFLPVEQMTEFFEQVGIQVPDGGDAEIRDVFVKVLADARRSALFEFCTTHRDELCRYEKTLQSKASPSDEDRQTQAHVRGLLKETMFLHQFDSLAIAALLLTKPADREALKEKLANYSLRKIPEIACGDDAVDKCLSELISTLKREAATDRKRLGLLVEEALMDLTLREGLYPDLALSTQPNSANPVQIRVTLDERATASRVAIEAGRWTLLAREVAEIQDKVDLEWSALVFANISLFQISKGAKIGDRISEFEEQLLTAIAVERFMALSSGRSNLDPAIFGLKLSALQHPGFAQAWERVRAVRRRNGWGGVRHMIDALRDGRLTPEILGDDEQFNRLIHRR